jgi:hypothetical protein
MNVDCDSVSLDSHGRNSNKISKNFTVIKGMLLIEITHAFHMLSDGHYRIIETFFTPSYYQTSVWSKVKEKLRGQLITVNTFNHYRDVAVAGNHSKEVSLHVF